jgi:hypothetical protein
MKMGLINEKNYEDVESRGGTGPTQALNESEETASGPRSFNLGERIPSNTCTRN